MFQARLGQIIDMGHPKAVLARKIDWRHLAERFGEAYSDEPGHPALPTRLMAWLQILKFTENLSDEVLCSRWVENPYYQYFCGEAFFRHELPFDRSSMTRWRQRMGDSSLLLQVNHPMRVGDDGPSSQAFLVRLRYSRPERRSAVSGMRFRLAAIRSRQRGPRDSASS